MERQLSDKDAAQDERLEILAEQVQSNFQKLTTASAALSNSVDQNFAAQSDRIDSQRQVLTDEITKLEKMLDGRCLD